MWVEVHLDIIKSTSDSLSSPNQRVKLNFSEKNKRFIKANLTQQKSNLAKNCNARLRESSYITHSRAIWVERCPKLLSHLKN